MGRGHVEGGVLPGLKLTLQVGFGENSVFDADSVLDTDFISLILVEERKRRSLCRIWILVLLSSMEEVIRLYNEGRGPRARHNNPRPRWLTQQSTP